MSNAIRTHLVETVILQCGDNLWGECKQYPRKDWEHEVENQSTVLGYWEWCISQAESDQVDCHTLFGIHADGPMSPTTPDSELKSDDQKIIGYDLARKFMTELLDSVETLSGIAEQYGARTLADIMFLHCAILSGGFIDFYTGESAVMNIARGLPSGEQWVSFIKTEYLSQSLPAEEEDSRKTYELVLRGFVGGDDTTDHLILWVGSELPPLRFGEWLRENDLYTDDKKGVVVDWWPITIADDIDFNLPAQTQDLKKRIEELVRPALSAVCESGQFRMKDFSGAPVGDEYLNRINPLISAAADATTMCSEDELEEYAAKH